MATQHQPQQEQPPRKSGFEGFVEGVEHHAGGINHFLGLLSRLVKAVKAPMMLIVYLLIFIFLISAMRTIIEAYNSIPFLPKI